MIINNQVIDEINSDLQFLFPLNRSLANEAFDSTCSYLLRNLPFKIRSVKSGSKVFDWVVPPRWELKVGWIKNKNGKKIIDSENSNLHVASYSESVHKKVMKTELLNHISTMPEMPDAIPYRTTYYDSNWHFCAQHSILNSDEFLEPFEVFIDASKTQGDLKWYEIVFPGTSKNEILISTYSCHPSMANDNLSGPVTFKLIANWLSTKRTKFTYRLIIAPETIGAIAHIATSETIEKTVAGFVVTTNGGSGPFGFKQTYLQHHWLDLLTKNVLGRRFKNYISYPFAPSGSDERQFSGPGVRIPIVTITKAKYHTYREYHTSLDDLKFIEPQSIFEAFDIYKEIIEEIENDIWPKRVNDYKCEFQLGKYNLYSNIGGINNQNSKNSTDLELTTKKDAINWIMFYSDGVTPLKYISQVSGIPVSILKDACVMLTNSGLIT